MIWESSNQRRVSGHVMWFEPIRDDLFILGLETFKSHFIISEEILCLKSHISLMKQTKYCQARVQVIFRSSILLSLGQGHLQHPLPPFELLLFNCFLLAHLLLHIFFNPPIIFEIVQCFKKLKYSFCAKCKSESKLF